jgi:hypothetical protein
MTSRGAAAISAAVRAWLDGLDDAQRARATFPFDSAERFVWAYTPEPAREGLPIEAMTPDQQAAASAIVAAAASPRAAAEIGAIIGLEAVLGELERTGGVASWRRRDSARYWHAVFGVPGSSAPWSWRIGGHHVAVQVTIADGAVIGATPSFLGANPARVPSGPRAGFRALPGEDDLVRATLAALAPAERAAAIVADEAPTDILTGARRHADVRSVPIGVRHADLGAAGRIALERLIRHVLGRSPDDVAAAAWSRTVAPDLGDVSFAWAGRPGQGHYAAVCGPAFVIEIDNTQDDANHVHAVWRELANDWGEDLLGRHLAAAHAPTGQASRAGRAVPAGHAGSAGPA